MKCNTYANKPLNSLAKQKQKQMLEVSLYVLFHVINFKYDKMFY